MIEPLSPATLNALSSARLGGPAPSREQAPADLPAPPASEASPLNRASTPAPLRMTALRLSIEQQTQLLSEQDGQALSSIAQDTAQTPPSAEAEGLTGSDIPPSGRQPPSGPPSSAVAAFYGAAWGALPAAPANTDARRASPADSVIAGVTASSAVSDGLRRPPANPPQAASAGEAAPEAVAEPSPPGRLLDTRA